MADRARLGADDCRGRPIVLAIKAWVVNPYRIPSSSMEPTLHCARSAGPASGCEAHFSDRVLANRFIYHLRDPNRGEISSSTRLRRRSSSAARANVRQAADRASRRADPREVRLFYINGKRLDDSSYIKPGRRDDRERFLDRSEELLLLRRRQPDAIVRLAQMGVRSARELDRAGVRDLLAAEPAPCRHSGALGAGILAILFGIGGFFVVLAVRRRRVR